MFWKFNQDASNLINYTRESLIQIRIMQQKINMGAFQHPFPIPEEIVRPPGSPWIIIPGSRHRKQRRAETKARTPSQCWCASLAKEEPHRPLLPSLFISSVRSINNKMDEWRLYCHGHTIGTVVIIITEAWLHPGIPDAAIELACHSTHRSDRVMEVDSVFYMISNWCTNKAIIDALFT